MGKTSNAQKKASAKYDKENTVIKSIKFNKNTDKILLDYITNIDNFQQYIKSLIKKDMEDKKMKEFKIEDLQAWNEEQEREDTLFTVEHHFYRKGINGDLIEKDGDCCFAQTNDFDEAMDKFNYCKKAYGCTLGEDLDEIVEIKLMRASQVYAGNLEYKEIESYSNLK